MAQTDSAVAGNGYTFACPTVGRDARYLVCAFKRTKVWKGQSIAEADCQCAMRGGKCPVIHMLKREWRTETRDFYDASSVKIHKLPADIAERIAPVVLTNSHAYGLELTAEQRLFLYGDAAPINTEILVPDKVEGAKKASKPREPRAALPAGNFLDGIADVQTDMSSMLNEAMR